jgi:hypothetical protein
MAEALSNAVNAASAIGAANDACERLFAASSGNGFHMVTAPRRAAPRRAVGRNVRRMVDVDVVLCHRLHVDCCIVCGVVVGSAFVATACVGGGRCSWNTATARCRCACAQVTSVLSSWGLDRVSFREERTYRCDVSSKPKLCTCPVSTH